MVWTSPNCISYGCFPYCSRDCDCPTELLTTSLPRDVGCWLVDAIVQVEVCGTNRNSPKVYICSLDTTKADSDCCSQSSQVLTDQGTDIRRSRDVGKLKRYSLGACSCDAMNTSQVPERGISNIRRKGGQTTAHIVVATPTHTLHQACGPR